MIIAFQIILLVVIVISFMGVVAEKNKTVKEKIIWTFLAGLVAFVVSVLWL